MIPERLVLRTATLLCVCLTLWACSNDDGGGSDAPAEPAPGENVTIPGDDGTDTDGDGLTDFMEEVMGTDPMVVDTDMDGYGDGDEHREERDPNDAESRIYVGGWPYNAEKDAIEDPTFDPPCPGGVGCACTGTNECESGACQDWPRGRYCAAAVGTRIPRFIAQDQFGDRVDLYDFAYQGKPVVIDMSTGWCRPCKELAAWFLDGEETVFDQPWWNSEWVSIRDMVLRGDVYWITVLYENANHGPVDAATVEAWYEAFPHEEVPVVGDVGKQLHGWLKPSGIPAVSVLDEEMRFLLYSSRGLQGAFDLLIEMFPE